MVPEFALGRANISLTGGNGLQIVEVFEFVRLHWQYGDASGTKGQESVRTGA
jgi:hypothetical protein